MAIHTRSAAAQQLFGDRDSTRASEPGPGGPDDRDAERAPAILTSQFGRGVQVFAVAAAILVIAAVARLVIVAPWAVGFGLAVVSAIAWCVWLEGARG